MRASSFAMLFVILFVLYVAGRYCTRESRYIGSKSIHGFVRFKILTITIVTLSAVYAIYGTCDWRGGLMCCVVDDLNDPSMPRISGEWSWGKLNFT